MLLMTIGGDMRYAYLTAQAASESMEIVSVGLEKCPFALPAASLSDISSAGALILPNPWRTGMQLPLASQPFTLNEVLSRASPDTLLLLSDTIAMPSVPPFPLIDLSEDENYILDNARLTAEAALFAAYQKTGRTFMNARCLVIGFGRIGRRLALLLKSLGADVAVAARKPGVRLNIIAEGLSAFSMEELAHLLPHAQFIFSTPPARVLHEAHLRLISPEACLFDLASPPYGFDLDTARSCSVRAFRESGLPGRCCPESAAAILLAAVKSALARTQKGEFSCP